MKHKKDICPECGGIKDARCIMCKSCRSKPENNSQYGKTGENSTNWKGGYKNYCIDCGKELVGYYAKRCLKCNGILRSLPLNTCVDCGKKIERRATRCQKCAYRGRVFSEEHKQKISDNHVDVSGDKNPSWKGGLSCEPYCQVWTDKEFKQGIKDRDNNIAWDIGYWWKGSLSIHHIDYDKKNCHPSNLITVSAGMNASANYNREWHTEWFQILMNKRKGKND